MPFGVQKIVGFARALALEPTVMLLDEPSAGLNREERENLARFILRIERELEMTIIWIEHDMQMIADLADRIHVLDYGRTLAEGAPASVLTDPGVLAAYLGTATSPGRQPKSVGPLWVISGHFGQSGGVCFTLKTGHRCD